IDHFEAEGYGVVPASTAEDALTLIQSYHPHLMIADITLPQMDGYDLVRKLRKLPAYRLLPIILLTARGQTEDRIRGYRLGCDVYVAKPCDLLELSAIVRNLLDRHQMMQSEFQMRREPDMDSGRLANPQEIPLGDREIEVLRLLSYGLSNRDIGTKLRLSPRTIEKYVSRLLQKTETSNRADLVRFAMEHQLVDTSPASEADLR
ncbi:MAG: response regulator transcription factor, partial [Thermosynechococcaceae cyanobacterium]